MNVDDAARETRAELGRKDLQIAGEDQKLCAGFLEKLQELRLLRLLRDGGNLPAIERDAILSRQAAKVLMIGHDRADLGPDLTDGDPLKKVSQAMPQLGNHDDCPHR